MKLETRSFPRSKAWRVSSLVPRAVSVLFDALKMEGLKG